MKKNNDALDIMVFNWGLWTNYFGFVPLIWYMLRFIVWTSHPKWLVLNMCS